VIILGQYQVICLKETPAGIAINFSRDLAVTVKKLTAIFLGIGNSGHEDNPRSGLNV